MKLKINVSTLSKLISELRLSTTWLTTHVLHVMCATLRLVLVGDSFAAQRGERKQLHLRLCMFLLSLLLLLLLFVYINS